MKTTFKIAALLLLGLLVAILLSALFVKKEYSVERGITINKPKQAVFDYVKYLKNQNDFSVWSKIDPGMKQEFRGTDGTAGFISAWDSENKHAGKGEQEILKITDGERIDYEIRFLEPMKSTNNACITFKAVNDSITNVKWSFFGKIKYPVNLSLVFMDMDAMLGKDLEGGLANLKSITEK